MLSHVLKGNKWWFSSSMCKICNPDTQWTKKKPPHTIQCALLVSTVCSIRWLEQWLLPIISPSHQVLNIKTNCLFTSINCSKDHKNWTALKIGTINSANPQLSKKKWKRANLKETLAVFLSSAIKILTALSKKELALDMVYVALLLGCSQLSARYFTIWKEMDNLELYRKIPSVKLHRCNTMNTHLL